MTLKANPTIWWCAFDKITNLILNAKKAFATKCLYVYLIIKIEMCKWLLLCHNPLTVWWDKLLCTFSIGWFSNYVLKISIGLNSVSCFVFFKAIIYSNMSKYH
jgi:hypothetical protein